MCVWRLGGAPGAWPWVLTGRGAERGGERNVQGAFFSCVWYAAWLSIVVYCAYLPIPYLHLFYTFILVEFDKVSI